MKTSVEMRKRDLGIRKGRREQPANYIGKRMSYYTPKNWNNNGHGRASYVQPPNHIKPLQAVGIQKIGTQIQPVTMQPVALVPNQLMRPIVPQLGPYNAKLTQIMRPATQIVRPTAQIRRPATQIVPQQKVNPQGAHLVTINGKQYLRRVTKKMVPVLVNKKVPRTVMKKVPVRKQIPNQQKGYMLRQAVPSPSKNPYPFANLVAQENARYAQRVQLQRKVSGGYTTTQKQAVPMQDLQPQMPTLPPIYRKLLIMNTQTTEVQPTKVLPTKVLPSKVLPSKVLPSNITYTYTKVM